MRLILPLDAAYTIFNGIYMTGAAILRIHRNEMYVEQYTSIYYVFMTVNLKKFFVNFWIIDMNWIGIGKDSIFEKFYLPGSCYLVNSLFTPN